MRVRKWIRRGCCSASANGGCNARWRDHPKIISSSITSGEVVKCHHGPPNYRKTAVYFAPRISSGREASFVCQIDMRLYERWSIPSECSWMPFCYENSAIEWPSDARRSDAATLFIEYFVLEDRTHLINRTAVHQRDEYNFHREIYWTFCYISFAITSIGKPSSMSFLESTSARDDVV